MAIVSFNKKLFEKEIGKLDEKMQNRIAMFGTTLENIGDEEIEVDISANRPDLFSYQGFKRSFLGFLGKKSGLKEYKLNKPEKDFAVIIDSSVKEIRPYTACAIVKELKFDNEKIKEIIEIQEKLHLTIGRKRKKLAIGIYPLEKIVLPITFKAMEPDRIKFIPLETEREMSGLEILQRHPAGREYAHLLAGKTKFPIFVDAKEQVLSMPPIINSQLTGKITENTTDVFIECSGFDFNLLKKCLNILVTSLADMGGKIYQMELKGSKKEVTPDLTPDKMNISIENTNKLLGLNLNEKQIKENLEKMGHRYSKGKVEIAAWRTDVIHEVDLIEDVAISYGYDNLEPEIPKISTIGREDGQETIKRKISDILTGLRMIEVSNYHLTTKKEQFLNMGITEKQEKEFVELESSKTNYDILRKDLSHYLLKNLAENIDSVYPQYLFELGRIFELKEKIIEKENLAVAISPGNFTESRQILEYLARMLGLKIKLREMDSIPEHFIEGRTAEITLDNQVIGIIGEIHPKILRKWKIKMPVALFEMNLEKIFEKLI
ncbi:MAG: phenylalanine--tRNA ligase subunit beta [archaeon]